MARLCATASPADRYGERWVIAGGLALTAVFALAAAAVPGYLGLGVCLLLGGAAAASTNAASGRVVVGWFPRARRGLAMGIRQVSQPLGVAVAALAVPLLAARVGTWAPLLLAAGLIAAAQFLGAAGRILVGQLSDQVGSRVHVLRWVAVSGVTVMLALAGCGALHWPVATAVALVAASAVSVADNGLSYTSVAEAAGPAWSGKALGIQNTGQFIAASAVGPGIGALITAVGYPVAFALVAVTPLAAIPLVPTQDAIENILYKALALHSLGFGTGRSRCVTWSRKGVGQ